MAERTSSSTALGLSVAGVAALFIISGIQKKSLSQILEGDIGGVPTGSGISGETTPGSEAITGEAGPSNTVTEAPHNAPNPLVAGKEGIAAAKRCKELHHGLSLAVPYLEQLEREVSSGKIPSAMAITKFHAKYPWYRVWYDELTECNEGKNPKRRTKTIPQFQGEA